MESSKFSSLHEYLDCVLGDSPNASFEEIKDAKKAYWKLYYTNYRREKRKKRKEFSLGFYPKELKQINRKRGDETVSQFLYKSIFKELQSEKKQKNNCESFSEIHQQLRELINLMEEYLDTEPVKSFEDMLERFEELEDVFTKLLNQ